MLFSVLILQKVLTSCRSTLSLTFDPLPTLRSATMAQEERQSDRKCSYWFRTLSASKHIKTSTPKPAHERKHHRHVHQDVQLYNCMDILQVCVWPLRMTAAYDHCPRLKVKGFFQGSKEATGGVGEVGGARQHSQAMSLQPLNSNSSGYTLTVWLWGKNDTNLVYVPKRNESNINTM